jgi:hypothetical protein
LQITILEHPSNEVIKLLEATITDGQTSNYNVVEMKDLEMSRDAAQIIFKLWERNVLASAAWHWESSIVGSKKHHNKRWLLFRILLSTTILLNSDIEKPKPIKGSQPIKGKPIKGRSSKGYCTEFSMPVNTKTKPR